MLPGKRKVQLTSAYLGWNGRWFAIRCCRLLHDLTISIVHLQIFVDLKCDLPNPAAAIDRYVHVGFHRPCRNYDSFLSKFLKTFVDVISVDSSKKGSTSASPTSTQSARPLPRCPITKYAEDDDFCLFEAFFRNTNDENCEKVENMVDASVDGTQPWNVYVAAGAAAEGRGHRDVVGSAQQCHGYDTQQWIVTQVKFVWTQK